MLILFFIIQILSTAQYQIYSRHDRFQRRSVIHIFVHDLFGANLRVSILDPKERARKVYERISLKEIEPSNLFFNESLNAFQSSFLSVFIIPIDHIYYKNKKLNIRFDLYGNSFTETILLDKCKGTHLKSDFLHYTPEYFDKLSSSYKLVIDELEKMIDYQNSVEKIFIHNEDLNLQFYNNEAMLLFKEIPDKILKLKNINKVEEKRRLSNYEIELYNTCSKNLSELYNFYTASRNMHIGIVNKLRECLVHKKKMIKFCQKYLSEENESELQNDLINFKNFLTVKDLQKYENNNQPCFLIKSGKKLIKDIFKITKKNNYDQIVPIYTINQNYEDNGDNQNYEDNGDNGHNEDNEDNGDNQNYEDNGDNEDNEDNGDNQDNGDNEDNKQDDIEISNKDNLNESLLQTENIKGCFYTDKLDKYLYTEKLEGITSSSKNFVLSIFIVIGVLLFGFLHSKLFK